MTPPNSTRRPRLSPVDTGADALFVYGTLRFRRILTALLGQVPPAAGATASGWRTAALRNRPYPGLVPAPGRTAHGLLLTGLTAHEWRVLDDFEDDAYELRTLVLDRGDEADGAGRTGSSAGPDRTGRAAPRRAWAYVWASPSEIRPADWEADTFAEARLDGYAARLEAAALRTQAGRR
ncbi:gamma-glutamylcyclotransferase family protein [Streptomyces reniochalinae]|uniref:Putative gamma-glutamylcyclotransferase n=1 Tax=Streptomyces reniochalinae TaxID=2250578 RepID=A0A367EAE0_9ACTN|nr:gamma-glutamylcyclotransferase family protein [Streptomyces reniochalinae]RCG14749.1 gamma-glutamylcyclotransferase [Streptomyces reniochalinae]